MTSALSHRGPDGEGPLLREQVAIGNRRLAIIDLAGGRQPMASADESLWITHNGEIYNYRELRTKLEGLGRSFATQSDTEVLLGAYAQWGPRCVERLRGMFSFAIVDWRRRQLLLARDPFGIKPLHFRRGPDYLAFASELGALRRVDDAPPTGDLQAIDYYLRYQYIPAPLTVFREIRKLPPASTLIVGFDGELAGPDRYWTATFDPDQTDSGSDWTERVGAAIGESVRAHLVADVPCGLLLSGGTDSTLVAAATRAATGHALPSFVAEFAEESFSELRWAREAAEVLELELRSVSVTDAALDKVADLSDRSGEPFGDSSALATLEVAGLARRELSLVLSGDGGDELFAGYDTYASWMNEAALETDAESSGASATPNAIRARWWREWEKEITYLPLPARVALWRPEWRALASSGCEPLLDAARRAPICDRLAFAQQMDLATYLPGAVLTKVDVASMRHGLEVRTPLLDRGVFEVASRLPLDQRFVGGGGPRSGGKPVLKHILEGRFAPHFVHRAKQGFALPRAAWFLPGRKGRERLESLILDPRSRLGRWFEREAIERELAAHHAGQDNSGVLWLLFVLAHWLERNPEVDFA